MASLKKIDKFREKFREFMNKPFGASEKNQHNADDEKLLTELVARGNQLLKEKNTDEAEKTFQSVIAQNPNEADGYAGLAQIAQAKKNWPKALNYWNKCFSIHPKNYPAWWLIKKANVLLALKAFDDAEPLLTEYCEREPGQIWGYAALAQIAAQKHLPKKELEIWEKIYNDFPDSFDGGINYARRLCYFEKCDQAENILQNLLLQYPASETVLETLAWTARGAKDYELAAQRFRELTMQFPNNMHYKRLYITSLMDNVQFDEAQSYFDQHFHHSTHKEDLLLQAKIYWEMLKVDEAIDLLKQLLVKHPGDAGITNTYVSCLKVLFRPSGNKDVLFQALSLLNDIKGGALKKDSLLLMQMDFYLLLDNPKKTIELFDQLQDKSSELALKWQAWKLKYFGDMDGAKLVWQQILETFHIPQVQLPAQGILQRKDSNDIATDAGDVLLFTAVRNERWRLPWFLNYYRKLGVDRFFFVDNDSSDETSAYLLAQKDVHVFYTNQSYAVSCSGMQWINYLVEQYGSNAWCMYVDVDEALVFPDSENKSLKDLTGYMALHGYEAMYAFMLDMFAPGENPMPKGNEYTNFAQDYPLFENQYHRINSKHCPYFRTAGGVRRSFNINENQTKTPIIKGGRGIKFLLSSHRITPAKLSDVTGALLHFKMAGNYKQIFSQDLELNNRMPRCRRRHWAYLQQSTSTPNADAVNEHTKRFTSSRQLVDLGLINTSEAFKTFENDRNN